MSSSFLEALAQDRQESQLADKKPLLSLSEARAESERCLYCVDAPCIKACPTEIDIPTFIKKIATGNVLGSAKTIFEQNILGYSCARVCPVEVLCEGSCVYTGWQKSPIKIGRLQRYATEHATADLSTPLFTPKAPSGKRVALIGAGPASLSCAAYLRLEGHAAVIFEKRALPGGLNTTGVAPYKLHTDDALREVEWLRTLGVEFQVGIEVGKEITGESLLRDFDAVFIGIGLGDDSRLRIPGEDGPSVLGATAWIEQLKLQPSKSALGRVVVVGGGNTAVDVVREAALLGATDVTMVYRRTGKAMSAYEHELDGARKEGVRVVTERQPTEILRDANGSVHAIRLARTHDGTPDESDTLDLPCDCVVLAIGQSKLSSLASQFSGVTLDKRGCLVIDPSTAQTGNPKVFSGGDCVNGGKEVVNAVADGRNAARELSRRFSS